MTARSDGSARGLRAGSRAGRHASGTPPRPSSSPRTSMRIRSIVFCAEAAGVPGTRSEQAPSRMLRPSRRDAGRHLRVDLHRAVVCARRVEHSPGGRDGFAARHLGRGGGVRAHGAGDPGSNVASSLVTTAAATCLRRASRLLRNGHSVRRIRDRHEHGLFLHEHAPAVARLRRGEPRELQRYRHEPRLCRGRLHELRDARLLPLGERGRIPEPSRRT